MAHAHSNLKLHDSHKYIIACFIVAYLLNVIDYLV